MKTSEVSVRVQSAIREISKGSNEYEDLAKKISNASIKFNITEKFLRRIGCWKLNSIDNIMYFYNNSFKENFIKSFKTLCIFDKNRVIEAVKPGVIFE
jgi:hypothetical protein